MGVLKWFNRDTYATLEEVLTAVRKELEALQPQDSVDIVWSRDANGLSAKLRNKSVSGETTSEPEDTISEDGSSDEYNGMHKLVLITDNSNPDAPLYKVCVCDGATYSHITHESGESRVDVNGVSFDMASTVFELEKNQYAAIICIKFTPGTQTQESKVEYIKTYRRLPSNTSTEVYYLIGRVVYTGEMSIPYVHQDHLSPNGTVSMLWRIACDA